MLQKEPTPRASLLKLIQFSAEDPSLAVVTLGRLRLAMLKMPEQIQGLNGNSCQFSLIREPVFAKLFKDFVVHIIVVNMDVIFASGGVLLRSLLSLAYHGKKCEHVLVVGVVVCVPDVHIVVVVIVVIVVVVIVIDVGVGVANGSDGNAQRRDDEVQQGEGAHGAGVVVAVRVVWRFVFFLFEDDVLATEPEVSPVVVVVVVVSPMR